MGKGEKAFIKGKELLTSCEHIQLEWSFARFINQARVQLSSTCVHYLACMHSDLELRSSSRQRLSAIPDPECCAWPMLPVVLPCRHLCRVYSTDHCSPPSFGALSALIPSSRSQNLRIAAGPQSITLKRWLCGVRTGKDTGTHRETHVHIQYH